MEAINLKLAALWIVLMFIYLLGDVLRIFSGDITPGKIDGVDVSQMVWLGCALLMLIPILMIYLSLALPQPINRWANIIVASFFLLLNLFSLHTYPSWYDPFLLTVSLVFNGLTIWHAWRWS